MTLEEPPFGFTAPWYALGVVTPALLAELQAEWARGEDRSPEHYRWRAFLGYVSEQRPLSAAQASALYELGRSDPDRPMGEAMMHRVVELPECPADVVEAAVRSGTKHLVRAAQARDRRA